MRIALVIGGEGGWLWHKRLVEKLSSFGAVDLVAQPHRSGAAAARAWVGVEQRLFHLGGGATPVSADALGAQHDADLAQFDVVIDLAGALPAGAAALTLRYDGEAGDAALIGRLLRREAPAITVEDAAGAALASSYPAIEDRDVLARALAFVFARAGSLVERAVKRLAGGAAPPPLDLPPARAPAPCTEAALIAFVARSFAGKLIGKLAGKRRSRQMWASAVRSALPLKNALPAPGPYRKIVMPGECADPFLFAHDGKTYLFVEKMKPDGRGVLAWALVDPDGAVGPFTEFMDDGDHLSYPFVFEEAGAIWMLPETGARKSLTLFRATAFPGAWRQEVRLLDGATIADATLFRHDGRWWLFAAMAEGEGSTHDELFAFWSDALTGPWTAHSANPLKSDARSARPAGKVMAVDGRLLRPAQDCERHYGGALAWCEILKLTPDEFEERVIDRWEAESFGAYVGVHTYNRGGGFEAIDLLEMRARA